MVRPEGFELPTYRFVACCSIQLSHERPTTANIGETSMTVKLFFLMFAISAEKSDRVAFLDGVFPESLAP